MKRIVTYDDWQIDYDKKNDTYYATDEDGTYECELIHITDETKHNDYELLCGNFVGQEFDFGGEFDEPIQIDLGIVDGVHKYDYVYQYGYWKIKD